MWLYGLVVLLNAAMLALSIGLHMPVANIVVWSFATVMWTWAAIERYKSRSR